MFEILELDHDEARNYFLEGVNYVNFGLPSYFNFDILLDKISKELGEKELRECYRVQHDGSKTIKLKPENYEGVNYSLFSNKDGEFAWRPFEIINPVIYVSLVHKITQKDNWGILINRFKEFKNTCVICESIPMNSTNDETHKAMQIKKWWTNYEQTSIKMGIKYQYVFDVDVANCYGSIYTHSIAWALHGKDEMKNKRKDSRFLGNCIDSYIQKMRYGQTNGIPQGSVLMDFIAEIVLGYADILLTKHLEGKLEEFHIVRYRDDYKIFTNNPELGREIVKYLSQVLSGLGMRLNTSKTKLQNDPIFASIKPDKIYELFIPRTPINKSKWLLQIYSACEKYPNSGMTTRLLNKFYRAIQKTKKLEPYENAKVMISVMVNMTIKSPRTYDISMAIISKLLKHCSFKDQVEIIGEIRSRLDRVANTGLLDVWLQRVSYKIDKSIIYKECLTKLIGHRSNPGNILWNSSWLNTTMSDLLDIPVTNRTTVTKMPKSIPIEEVALFRQTPIS